MTDPRPGAAPPTGTPSRGPERRRAHVGAPGGVDRRERLDDRRAENNRLHVSFQLGALAFVLGIEHVREVVRAQALTPVPLAPEAVAGLINLRGEIVPVIDLRPSLGAGGRPAEPGQEMLVVIRGEAGPYSLVVDAVHDVLAISPSMLVPPPANLPAALAPLTAAVCKQADGLLLVFDVAGVAPQLGARGAA